MNQVELQPTIGSLAVSVDEWAKLLSASILDALDALMNIFSGAPIVRKCCLKVDHLDQRLILNKADVMVQQSPQEAVSRVIQAARLKKLLPEIIASVKELIPDKMADGGLKYDTPSINKQHQVEAEKNQFMHGECLLSWLNR